MSRIGKLPVDIPGQVTVSVEANVVSVEGPKGKLKKEFPNAVTITKEEAQIIVAPSGNSRFSKAMYGTVRSLIANMVTGVVDGYSKDLEISGVGFRAALNGNNLDLNLGYSHPCLYAIPSGITITVKDNTKLKVEGIDKQMVGEAAASIRAFYPPEPYKGKGVKIVGEYVRRKEGKTAGK
ncbi:MAG: 50S ribosomal protein L6 [Verrucomicrobia bacterium]|nr:50S ribosomal protein L6 [Verrucomicrobiota bacterium]MDA1064932.1 50S ribosomal protein L6 [Verrucomicrobiota bacterium]